ncbi:hypothetical protein B0H13DRAFT_1903176 [Mycena leptocephala]|nr:hypothetical protein B0H13DRAFT_1903176 [Mycena leptocephala]
MTCGTGGSFKPPTFPVGVDSIDIMRKSASAESECMRTPGLDQELYHSRTYPNSGRRRSLQLPFAPCLEKPNLGKKRNELGTHVWAACLRSAFPTSDQLPMRNSQGQIELVEELVFSSQSHCHVCTRRLAASNEIATVDFSLVNNISVIWGDLHSEMRLLVDEGLGEKPFVEGRHPKGPHDNLPLKVSVSRFLACWGPMGSTLEDGRLRRRGETFIAYPCVLYIKYLAEICESARITGNKTTSPQKDDPETESIRGVQYEKHSIPVELPTPEDVKQNKTKNVDAEDHHNDRPIGCRRLLAPKISAAVRR